MRIRHVPGLPAGIPKGTTLNQFFPGKVTIVAGDTVTFSSATFHTVTYGHQAAGALLPRSGEGASTRAPTTRRTTRSTSTGWRSSSTTRRRSARSARRRSPGKTPTSSGGSSPAGPKAKPATFTYTFPKAGTLQADLHHPSGHEGDGRRQAGGQRGAADADAGVGGDAAAAVNAGWAKTKAQAAAAKPPAKTVYMGVGNDATILGYFPNKLTVKAGTTVTFVNKSRAGGAQHRLRPEEVHRGAPEEDRPVPARARRARTRPRRSSRTARSRRAVTRYDGTNHGNGYLATPLTIGNRARAAAALVDGHVHEARQVQVLLLDPRA